MLPSRNSKVWAFFTQNVEEVIGALVVSLGLRHHLSTIPTALFIPFDLIVKEGKQFWHSLQSKFDFIIPINGTEESFHDETKKWKEVLVLPNFGIVVNPLTERWSEEVLEVDLLHGNIIGELPEKLSLLRFVGNSTPLSILSQPAGETGKETFQTWVEYFQIIAHEMPQLKKYFKFGNASPSLLNNMPVLESNDSASCNMQNSIAVIGYSLRFPGANSPKEFWNLLIHGEEALSLPPNGRWTPEKCGEMREEEEEFPGHFLSCSETEFDAKFFGISPGDAEIMDPQQRLLLRIAWEAIESAGISPVSLHGTRTGVFAGSWLTDYRNMITKFGKDEAFFRLYFGNSMSLLSSRISHVLGLTGPSISTESGCSSSMVAVDLACRSLKCGESNLCLVGGVNLLLSPVSVDDEGLSSVLAKNGRCKTFDSSADGFGRAEGCAVLVLKRYSDAVRDGDQVHALIRGSAVVQEGLSKSLGTPTKECESMAMELALKDAEVFPEDVSFVEMHGTGTETGDPIEVSAVAKAYSTDNRKEALVIGSVKTNIGHTEAVCGIAGIIKTILSMTHGVIPAHQNFKNLNPLIDLASIPAIIPLTPTEWKVTPRIAGVSSFGITGTDAHIILQEAPDDKFTCHRERISKTISPKRERKIHLLTFSAKTESALQQYMKEMQHFIQNSEEDLSTIAQNLNVARGPFQFRVAITAQAKDEAVGALKNDNLLIKGSPANNTTHKLCFLFPGQGSQHNGMAKELYEENAIFKLWFDRCSDILDSEYNIDIKSVMWNDEMDPDKSELNNTKFSQPAIFCVEFALLKLLDSLGIYPSIVLGHSLGEFCAAVAAGILHYKDALKLVTERSILIHKYSKQGKMLAVKENVLKVNTLLAQAFEKDQPSSIDIAAVNAPDQTVVAGDTEDVLKFEAFLSQRGVKTTALKSEHAFHSMHMDPILNEYRKVAENITYSQPSCIYISGMNGRNQNHLLQGSLRNWSNWPSYWVRHCRDRVRFSSAVRAVLNEGCSHFLEIGPHPVLSALVKMNADAKDISTYPCLRKQLSPWPCLLTTLGHLFVDGFTLDFKGLFPLWQPHRRITNLPGYPFKGKPYWFPSRNPTTSNYKSHSLLGNKIDISLNNNFHVFEADINIKREKWLEDHMIGGMVLFPGACFLEMMTKALSLLEDSEDGKDLIVSDFSILSPLQLRSEETTKVQTIIDETDAGVKITISSKLLNEELETSWILHAKAKVGLTKESQPIVLNGLPYPEPNEKKQLNGFSKDKTQSEQFYFMLKKAGLKFGHTFRTLRNLKEHNFETGVYTFEVELTRNMTNYTTPPVLIDAMFQSIVFAKFLSGNGEMLSLHVPVAVKQCKIFQNANNQKITKGEKCFVFVKQDSVVLVNSRRNIVCQMDEVVLVETSLESISAAVEEQKLTLPEMYEENWKRKLGPLEKRADLGVVFDTFENQEAVDLETILTNSLPMLQKTKAVLRILDLSFSPNFTDLANLFQKFERKICEYYCVGTTKPEVSLVCGVEFIHHSIDFSIDYDPITNCLVPQYFDIIISPESWNEQSVAMLLRPGGFVISKSPSQIGKNAGALQFNITNKAWWLLGNCECRIALQIKNKLETFGRQVVLFSEADLSNNQLQSFICSDQHLEGIIFLSSLSPFETSCKQFLRICQFLFEFPNIRLYLITNGAFSPTTEENVKESMLQAMLKTFQNETGYKSVKGIDISSDNSTVEVEECIMPEMVMNGHVGTVQFNEDGRLVPRLSALKEKKKILKVPKGRFRLAVPATRVVADLRFMKDKESVLGEFEVEVRVKSYALNFRDIFVILKPVQEFETMNTFGLDFSGVVARIGKKVDNYKEGDPVFGLRSDTEPGMKSHLILHQNDLLPLPDQMSFHEASCIPTVFATVSLALQETTTLTKNDTILIHTASGGVGLAAIQFAKTVGARIIVTAGSERKRAYLKSLGLSYVLNSRSTDFGVDMRKALNGSGVTVVLNSLTSPGFKEASLSLCEDGARFIEMSKVNVWTEEEVRKLRPDVKYTIIDLATYKGANLLLKKDLSQIKPIPYTRFDVTDIHAAFTFLQQAKHIGKVVVQFPEEDETLSLFSGRGTYVITGGLGGIGFQVGKWMIKNGAKNVALVGRHDPQETMAKELGQFNSDFSCNLFPVKADVGCLEELRVVFENRASGLPAVRGILHCAGIISDSTFEHQTWEKYETVFRPKVEGGWNLHSLSQELGLNLEHFVLFSSAVSLLCPGGQSNYSAANKFLDSLAQLRNSRGLPVTVINWGQWGQVGMAKGKVISGFRPFSTTQGLAALEKILRSNKLQTCVCPADYSKLKNLPGLTTYLEEIKSVGSAEQEGTSSFSSPKALREALWKELDSTQEEGKLPVLKKYVTQIARSVLKFSSAEELKGTENLAEIGMDSLLMLEMKNSLSSLLDERVPLTTNLLKDCVTCHQIAERILDVLKSGAQIQNEKT